MDENIKENVTEQQEPVKEKTEQEKALEELQRLREDIERSNEVIKTGKGRLRLEKPITARDKEITELIYDFTELTGIEYTEALDGSNYSDNVYRITTRQALNIFARAAAKQTEDVDAQDIVAQIGMTDSVEAVQLATLFFNASTRAGRQRISKK